MTVILPRIVQIDVGLSGAIGRSWNQEFYIRGEVKRSGGRTPNSAKIEIYNLAPPSLLFLEQPLLQMTVSVGTAAPRVIFHGGIKKGGVRTKIAHPNQVTTIEAQDGGRIMQSAYFAGSYPAGTTRSQILTDALAANAIGRGHVAALPERVYQAATAYAAPLPDVLDELYSGEPVEWSLQSRIFTLLHDDQPTPGNALAISTATGMIGSPERTDKGVKVSTVQCGLTAPGAPFAVTSRLVNGSYKCSAVTDRFDTEGEWQADLIGTELAS